MKIELNERDVKVILIGLEYLKADIVWKETIAYYNNLILSIKKQVKNNNSKREKNEVV